jgi:hypothetical protein
MLKILATLSCLFLSCSLRAAEPELIFVRGEPAKSRGIQRVGDPLSQPGTVDFFSRAALAFKITGTFPPSAEHAFLIVDHPDQGLGLIKVEYDCERPDDSRAAESNPAYTAASAQIGYTRLGTGKPRRAIFRLDRPAFRHRQAGEADFRILGLPRFNSLRLVGRLEDGEWERTGKEIPEKIEPHLKLKRPIQLVVSAGADAPTRDALPQAQASMREFCPLASALGFNAIESYVKWNFAEYERGRFDWSYYDAVANSAGSSGLKWFPLLIVGSAYTLPEWYHSSPLNIGFECLEHGIRNDIQTIFCENQTPFVQAFLKSFGAHFEPTGSLLGVRLGPSGNYGESQYPAGGNWGYKGQLLHIHIGWWAADPFAAPHFQRFLTGRYRDIGELNRAWGEAYPSFAGIGTFIPQFADSKRKRLDMADWYMDAMTQWCERWAEWTRKSMPRTEIYQSAGGWGFVESGTDFTDQTKSMVKVKGGIRATNETDSYSQNFYATRMLSSAARFYGVPFGSEPAGFGSARGVVARIYNILVNNGQHLFYYFPNLLDNDQGVDKWLENAPLLDSRENPFIEVAALYPDTKSKLDDAVFRNLYAFAFNQRVAALRPHLDFDFCSERMVRDGALSRYKVLLFLWSDIVEGDALKAIDQWVRKGGTVIYPYWSRMPLGSVEDDFGVYNGWLRGETGSGRVIFYRGDREPPHRYADFIRQKLDSSSALDKRTLRMLRVQKPSEVYVSILQSGTLAVLNYNDIPVQIRESGSAAVTIQPYSIKLIR